MKIARVIGNIWATHKEPRLTGLRFVVVQPVNRQDEKESEMIVAADPLGAGIGQDVLLVEGSTAVRALRNSELPVDAAVVAIVEKLELSSE
jgi:ethanolamine utilization protein EutN